MPSSASNKPPDQHAAAARKRKEPPDLPVPVTAKQRTLLKKRVIHSASKKRDDALLAYNEAHHMGETRMSTSPAYTGSTSRRLKIVAGLLFALVLTRISLYKGFCAYCTYYLKQQSKLRLSQPQYAVAPNDASADLYIYVSIWGEEIANWRYSITEMLMVAKSLNATFVEPCISGSRLRKWRTDDESHQQITLSDVFIMDKLKEFYPRIVSYKQFHHETTNAGTDINATFVQRICHQLPRLAHNKLFNKRCDEGTRNNHGKSMDPMMKAAIQRSLKQKTIIEIYQYFKDGWEKMKYKGQDLVDYKRIKYVVRNNFHFKPEMYDFVDTILKEAGIQDGKYSVIQWRGELHSLDYVSCAKHVITARDIMTEKKGLFNKTDNGNNKNPFVLISSLNRNESMSWNKKVRGTEVQEALGLLIDTHGFIKLDSFVNKHQDFFTDSVFLAVVDLIIAEKAEEFATCDGSCSKSKKQLRSANGKDSTSCWPERNQCPYCTIVPSKSMHVVRFTHHNDRVLTHPPKSISLVTVRSILENEYGTSTLEREYRRSIKTVTNYRVIIELVETFTRFIYLYPNTSASVN
eukprot:scaffold285110_cov60-Attheya_sp.AAC.1